MAAVLAGACLPYLRPKPYFIPILLRSQGSRLGPPLMLWWLGQNLLNVSVYIADARLRELPLAGATVAAWACAWLLGWVDRSRPS